MLFAGVLSLVAAGRQPAYAYNDQQALDLIVVTAQRRAENQQDVPIAITTIAGEALENNRIRTLESVNGFAAGMVATNTVSYGAAPLSIRGIGGANGGGNFFNDEPVSVYVDGVYVSRLSMSTADLLDIDSIQILRGPQGTLYGRNSTAGAVLISTRRPAPEPEAELRAGVSSIGDYRVSGLLSGALTDALSARAVVGYSNRDGYGVNIVNGENSGGGEDITARLSLRYQPHAAVNVDLIAEYQDRSAHPALIAVTNVGQTGAASPFALRADLDDVLKSRRFEFNDNNSTASETWSLTANAEIDLGFAGLGVITSFRDWSLTGEQDSDSTGLQLFTNSGAISAQQISSEMRLASAGDGPLTWLIGGFLLHDTTDVDFAIRNYQGLFGLGTNAVFSAAQKNNAYAAFADAVYDLTDQLSLTAGVRYSYETKSFDNDLHVSILNDGTAPSSFMGGATFSAGDVFSDPPVFVDRANFDDVSSRAVIEFKPVNEFLVYAGFSQGFKSGGFNSFGLTPAFNSESVDAFEVGIKTELADRRIRLNASAFYSDYSNLQIRLPVPTGGVEIRNVAAAHINGLEVEATAILSEGLSLETSLAFLDTEIVDGLIPAISTSISPFPIGAPLPLALEDVSGNRLTRAPAFQSHVSATYAASIGSLISTVNASFRYQDSMFFLETNQDADTFRNSTWGELDLRVSLTNASDHWEITLFAKNVTDQRHITAVTALGGFPNAAVNEPRRWGASLTFRR